MDHFLSAVHNWDRKAIARLLLETPLDEFENVWRVLGKTRELCPGYLDEIGRHLSWDEFSKRLDTVKTGDLTSLFEAFGVFGALGYPLKRSMLSKLAESMKVALTSATIEDLRIPIMTSTLMILTWYFPNDVQYAFGILDFKNMGSTLGQSLPRHWRSLCELSIVTRQCGSNLCESIFQACDLDQLVQQVRKYGPHNRYELRLLLNFLQQAPETFRRSFASSVRDVVRSACMTKDSEVQGIITAYHRLDPNLGAALSSEIGIAPKEHKEELNRAELEAKRHKFRILDGIGVDYEINSNELSPEPNDIKDEHRSIAAT